MKKTWSMAAAFATVGAIAACSSSNGAGAAGGQYDSCLQSLLGGSCISCLRSHCGGALGDFESGCGDYLGCICPGGDFSAPNAQSPTCGSKLQESACVSSVGDAGGFACGACESACALGGNTGSGGTSSSSGGSPNGGSSSGGPSSGCSGNSFFPGTMAVSLLLDGVDLGDAETSGWRSIGFDLDGLCTTSSSVDTCALAAGAPGNTQDDGANGIDSSFGENVCPFFDLSGNNAPCATAIQHAYLQTDASGAGTLVLMWGGVPLVHPVHDVHISMSGSGGMAGGVIPTSALTAAWQNAAPCMNKSLCSASTLQPILTQLAHASDILSDGSNVAGAACDGVSFGIKFTGSTPVPSVPSAPSCPCQ